MVEPALAGIRPSLPLDEPTIEGGLNPFAAHFGETLRRDPFAPEPPPERGIIGQTATGLVRGALGTGETLGEAISLPVPALGTPIANFFRGLMPESSGGVLEQATESVGRSLGTLGVVAGGLALSPIAAGPVALSAGVGTIFGAAEAARTRTVLRAVNDELTKRGETPLTPGEVAGAIATNGAIEGGGEFVANYLFNSRFGLGSAAAQSARASIARVLGDATNNRAIQAIARSAVGRFGEETARTAVREGVTEAGQAAGQAAVLRGTVGEENVASLRAAGIPLPGTPAEEGAQAAAVAAVSAPFFVAGGRAFSALQRPGQPATPAPSPPAPPPPPSGPPGATVTQVVTPSPAPSPTSGGGVQPPLPPATVPPSPPQPPQVQPAATVTQAATEPASPPTAPLGPPAPTAPPDTLPTALEAGLTRRGVSPPGDTPEVLAARARAVQRGQELIQPSQSLEALQASALELASQADPNQVLPSDVATKSNTPFRTLQTAAAALRRLNLFESHILTSVEGGFVLRPRADTEALAAVQSQAQTRRDALAEQFSPTAAPATPSAIIPSSTFERRARATPLEPNATTVQTATAEDPAPTAPAPTPDPTPAPTPTPPAAPTSQDPVEAILAQIAELRAQGANARDVYRQLEPTLPPQFRGAVLFDLIRRVPVQPAQQAQPPQTPPVAPPAPPATPAAPVSQTGDAVDEVDRLIDGIQAQLTTRTPEEQQSILADVEEGRRLGIIAAINRLSRVEGLGNEEIVQQLTPLVRPEFLPDLPNIVRSTREALGTPAPATPRPEEALATPEASVTPATSPSVAQETTPTAPVPPTVAETTTPDPNAHLSADFGFNAEGPSPSTPSPLNVEEPIARFARRGKTPGGERPDASPRTRALAGQALSDLGLTDQGTGYVLTSGTLKTRTSPAQPIRVRQDGTIEVARGLPDTDTLARFVKTGRAALEGRTVRDIHELAVALQPTRDPRFETFRRILVDAQGKEVGIFSVSSRLPSSAAAFPVPRGQSVTLPALKKGYAELRAVMRRLGAVGYYLAHNHPSGNPTPSGADLSLTIAHATEVPGFLGHVVIDSGRYSTITLDPETRKPRIQTFPLPNAPAVDPLLTPAFGPENTAVQDQDDVAQLAQAVSQPTFVTVALLTGAPSADATDGPLRVRGVLLVPEARFQDTEQARAYLERLQSEYGASLAVTYYEGQNRQVPIVAQELFRTRITGDHIQSDGQFLQHAITPEDVEERRVSPERAGEARLQRAGAVAVAEDPPPLRAEGQQRRFRAITPEIEEKLFTDYVSFTNIFPEDVANRLRTQGVKFSKERISLQNLRFESANILEGWLTNPREVATLHAAVLNGRALPTEFQAEALRALGNLIHEEQRAAFEAGRITQEEFDRFEDAMYAPASLWNLSTLTQSAYARGQRFAQERPSVQMYRDAMAKARQARDKLTPEESQALERALFDAYSRGDRRALRDFGQTLEDPRLRDYYFAFYYASLLTNPATVGINLFSTYGYMQFHNSIVRGVAGLLDPIVARLQGRDRQFYTQEALPAFTQGIRGFPLAAKRFWWLLRGKNKAGVADLGKFRRDIGGRSFQAWSRAAYSDGTPIEWMRTLAPVVETTGKVLEFTDVSLKGLQLDAGLAARAVRASLQQLGRRDAAFEANYIATAATRPAEQQALIEEAQRLTFTDAPGMLGNLIKRLHEVPGLGPFLQLLVPFPSTPDRLLRRGLELVPGIGLLPELPGRVQRRGGPGWQGWMPVLTPAARKDPELTEIAAKQLIGLLLSASLYALWNAGRIIGDAPPDEEERAAFYRQGKVPYSVVGPDGQVVQWRRFEPLSLPLGVAVSAFQAMDDLHKNRAERGEPLFGSTDNTIIDDGMAIAAATAHGVARYIIDASYFRGLAEFLGSASDQRPGSFQGGLLRQFVSAILPFSSLQRSLVRFLDAQNVPVGEEAATLIREHRTFGEVLQAQTPGLAGNVPARIDIFGQPVRQPVGSSLEAFLSPIRRSRLSDDAVERTLARIDYSPGLPTKTAQQEAIGRTITQAEYRRFLEVRGQTAKRDLDRLVSTGFFQRLSPERQKQRVQRVFTNATRAARQDVFGGRGTRQAS